MQAVIFDMDGVIFLTERHHVEVAKRLFSELDITMTSEEYVKFFMGRDGRVPGILEAFLQHKGREESLAKTIIRRFDEILEEEYTGDLTQKFILREKTKEFLQELKKSYKLAVATSTYRNRAKELLTQFEVLQYFSVLVGGDQVAKGKPDPEIYLTAAKQLKVDPASCVVIEDSFFGTTAASAAGMYCIGITDPLIPPPDLSAADIIVDSFSRAHEQIKKL